MLNGISSIPNWTKTIGQVERRMCSHIGTDRNGVSYSDIKLLTEWFQYIEACVSEYNAMRYLISWF